MAANLHHEDTKSTKAGSASGDGGEVACLTQPRLSFRFLWPNPRRQNCRKKSVAIPALGRSFQPGREGQELPEWTGAVQKDYVPAMETQLFEAHLRIERKRFAFDLRENPRGTFLRITEEVGCGRRNSIIIPMTGLEPFRDSLNEAIKFNKPPVERRTILSLWRHPKPETATSDRPADLTMGH
jgi:hypothetical protein